MQGNGWMLFWFDDQKVRKIKAKEKKAKQA